MSIAENLKKIKFQIAEACLKAGRPAQSCALVAVSKTKPSSQILEAMACGQFEFGENYVQEALLKISELAASANSLRWHFIGNLQSNKAHQVVGAFSLIHSVDRFSIAQAISKEARKKLVVQDILMQINVGDEKSKSGVSLDEASQLFEQILALENLRVCGLMCLPPLVEDIFEQRAYFRILSEFMKSHSGKLSDSQRSNFTILSMGTTHDFESAIFEGATHVRIGTAIFGERNVQ